VRIANLYYVYRDLLAQLPSRVPGYENLTAAEKLAAIRQYYYYYHGYTLAHQTLGWEAIDIPVNATSWLISWASEAGLAETDPDSIVIAQLKQFRPEVVFYHVHTPELLARIREQVPSIRLVAIPANTPIPDQRVFDYADIVVGCIPEVIEQLGAQGMRAYHVHHGFATHMTPTEAPGPKLSQLVFTGSIVRGPDFHAQREALLVELAAQVPLGIYAPMSEEDNLKLRQWVYDLRQLALTLPGADALLGRIPMWRKVQRMLHRPTEAVHPALRLQVQSAVYGMEMFALLRRAVAVLNVHIDISPRSASNIRLFEVTGIGGCLLTDWKENLHELFAPDTEVVSYRSTPEAVEKAKYLLAHPLEAEAIGLRAAARVAAEHTLTHRMAAQQAIFRKAIG
jgi:spore maturation protein CgeB